MLMTCHLLMVVTIFQCVEALCLHLMHRWTHVASLVPGKTKAHCFKRFKEMREEFRSKKGTGGVAE
jgi:DnaJ family protein C protein 2